MSSFNMAPIMQAFFEGVNLARQKKEWSDKQEQSRQEFEQQKLRDKALDEYRKATLEQDKRRLDLSASDQKAERAFKAVGMYGRGELQLPGGVSGMQVPDIRSSLLGTMVPGMNLPEIPGSGDLQVPGTEDEAVSGSQLPTMGNRPIDFANQWKQQQQLLSQQRLEQAMQIAQLRNTTQRELANERNATTLKAAQLRKSSSGSGSGSLIPSNTNETDYIIQGALEGTWQPKDKNEREKYTPLLANYQWKDGSKGVFPTGQFQKKLDEIASGRRLIGYVDRFAELMDSKERFTFSGMEKAKQYLDAIKSEIPALKQKFPGALGVLSERDLDILESALPVGITAGMAYGGKPEILKGKYRDMLNVYKTDSNNFLGKFSSGQRNYLINRYGYGLGNLTYYKKNFKARQ